MISNNHREMINIGLTIGIVALSVFIIHAFIPSMVWAAIIVIATYPLYTRWCSLFGSNGNCSALCFTTLIALLFLLPLSWLIGILVKELQSMVVFVQTLNRVGGTAPIFLSKLPVIGDDLVGYWNQYLGQPGKVKDLFANLHTAVTPATYYAKQIGINVAHRSVQVGFTLLSLFFFYRDSDKLLVQINCVGELCLGERWFRYSKRLPSALRSTVNGTIFVGFGVGVLMGICYALVDFPAPTLIGFITALAAMIPFVVPVVFIFVALILVTINHIAGAVIVLVWGTIVMFVADHFIKPVMIGNSIQLPFLAVLFGILGGVENLGILGLFLGPMVMVLFITLWQEPQ